MPGSTPRRNPAALVIGEAKRLAGAVDEAVAEALSKDPQPVIEQRFGITVKYVAATASSRCSIDGTYVAHPPTITVAAAHSGGRQRFSLLHELGHHQQRNDFDSVDLLNQAGKSRRTLEEDICDAFAAEVLLPEADVDAVLDVQLPSAAAVVQLFAHHQASRAACCVRIAQRIRSSGYVLLTDLDGRVAFTARAGDALPLARGTEQNPDSLFVRAVRGGDTRGKVRVTYPSGWQSPAFFGDFQRDGDWMFAVLQSQPPAWQVVPLTRDDLRPLPPEVDCPHCGETFFGRADPCERCGARTCPECGRCGCSKTPAPRTCQGCWLLLAPSRFPDDGEFCHDCV